MKYKKINPAKGIKANHEFVEFKQIQQEKGVYSQRQSSREYSKSWEDDRL